MKAYNVCFSPYRKLLAEVILDSKSSFSEFEKRHGRDIRFRGVDKCGHRESLFSSFVLELEKKERAKRIKTEFFALLKENPPNIDRHSRWSHVKKQVGK